MMPGPDIIIACPECASLAKVFSVASGNTFGATFWTDGKVDAPMLPRPPAITKCHHCDVIYWVEDADKIGEYSAWESRDTDVDPAWGNAPDIEELTEDECYYAVDSGLGDTPEREEHLRFMTWRSSNDRHRNPSTPDNPPRDDRCIANMRSLFDLLDTENVDARITKAEVARELGTFTEAITLLTTIDDEDREHIKSFLLDLCHQEITAVKKIPE